MLEHKINITSDCHFNSIQSSLQPGKFSPGSRVIINFKTCFFYPDAIVSLIFACEKIQNKGCELEFSGEERTLDYLSRMDFFSNINAPRAETFNRRANAKRFVCLKRITSKTYAESANELIDLIASNLKLDTDSFTAIEWAVGEVIDNVINHSESYGYVCGQFYPKKKMIAITVGDTGIGINSAFSKSDQLLLDEGKPLTDSRALTLALMKGVTNGEGQGNGLFGCKELIKQNDGYMSLYSGASRVSVTRKSGNQVRIAPFEGTIVRLEFNSENPINLANTSLHHSPVSSYLMPFDENEASRVVKILDECPSQKFRTDARSLRNKLRLISESIEDPLVLDFSEITSAGSSFLDELVSKLVEELSPPKFREKFQFMNLDPTIAGLLSYVVLQRNNIDLNELYQFQ